MPDNPQTPMAPWFPLSDHRLIALGGRDAVAFAHAQTMNDVAALANEEWHWNGWLTPKGRVIALFALLRLDTDTVWMVLPDADADAFVAQLRRFVFRSKVTIAIRDDLRVSGRLQASDLASGNHFVRDFSTGHAIETGSETIELDMSGELGADHPGRSLRIGPALETPLDGIDMEQSDLKKSGPEKWRRADLEHGWPRLDASQTEQWTPQQLSLERLRAYSVKKGCYPGQEIVARTHFLGQAKRGLVLVRSASPLAPGAELTSPGSNGDTKVGTVVSTNGDIALAVVSLDLLDATLQTNESPAAGGASFNPSAWSTQPLRTGLAR